MSNTPEYESMKDCIPELRLSFKADLLSISGEFLAARLISEDKEELMRNRNIGEGERAAELVSLIMDKVREDRDNYRVLLDILKKDYHCEQYKSIVDKLKEKYDMRRRGASGEKSSSSQESRRNARSSTSRSELRRSATPTLTDLDSFEYNGKTVSVIAKCAAKWETVALRLYFDYNIVDAIKRNNHYQTTECCTDMFDKWLSGFSDTRKPRTWATIVKILEEAGLGTFSEELDSILSN